MALSVMRLAAKMHGVTTKSNVRIAALISCAQIVTNRSVKIAKIIRRCTWIGDMVLQAIYQLLKEQNSSVYTWLSKEADEIWMYPLDSRGPKAPAICPAICRVTISDQIMSITEFRNSAVHDLDHMVDLSSPESLNKMQSVIGMILVNRENKNREINMFRRPHSQDQLIRKNGRSTS